MSRDFLADFIGLERGVFYTIKKLLFEPYEVVEAYKNKDSRICTPFSLIVLVFSFFFFVTYRSGVEEHFFKKVSRLAAKSGIHEIAEYFPLVWANLPFLFSLYILLASFFLAIFTRKLNLSFYDHVVANLYNFAVFMAPFTFLLLFLPLIDFNPDIFNLLMVGLFLTTIYLKKIKLRILFYYPEEVRTSLKKYMVISGILMALLLLSPLFFLILTGKI